MKETIFLTILQNGAKRIPMTFGFALALTFLHQDAAAQATMVPLGSDTSFAVLAGSGITSTGPTTINGNIGTYPTPAESFTGPFTLNGVDDTPNTGLMLNAQNLLTTAYGNAAGQPATTDYGAGVDLGGYTLVSGVYNSSSTMAITGTLTLNAQDNPNAVWIFQVGSALTTAAGAPSAPGSSIVLENGAQACHVFWQVYSSATLGTYSDFVGTIMAGQSITADTGADIDGRLLAENALVTLDNNTITVPVCNSGGSSVPDAGSTLLLLGSGLAALFAFGHLHGGFPWLCRPTLGISSPLTLSRVPLTNRPLSSVGSATSVEQHFDR